LRISVWVAVFILVYGFKKIGQILIFLVKKKVEKLTKTVKKIEKKA